MTAEPTWVRLRRDGTVREQSLDVRSGRGWHQTDRRGDLAVETWKPGKGWLPRKAGDLHARVDDAHAADHGQFARALDHAVKEIEARLVLGRLEADGRLAREAEVRGVDVRDLAAAVLVRADAEQSGVDRIAAKLAAGQ